MLGYILAIIAVLVIVPLVFFLMRGRQKPAPTAAEDSRHGTILQEPSREQIGSVDDEVSKSKPSPDRDA